MILNSLILLSLHNRIELHMKHLHSEGELRKMLANYEKLGLRRVARVQKQKDQQIHLDLTNVWHTKNHQQQKQYNALRDSGLFTKKRQETFLRFNFRHTENGTLNFDQAYKRMPRTSLSNTRNKKSQRGTMNITDLWGDTQMQKVIGSPSFPRDRLKILKVWGNRKKQSIEHDYSYRRLVTQY